MKLTLYRYYLLISIGLLSAYLLAIPINLWSEEIQSSNEVKVTFLLISIFPSICYYVVLMELWEKQRRLLSLLILTICLGSYFLSAWFISLILLGPSYYWTRRFSKFLKSC